MLKARCLSCSSVVVLTAFYPTLENFSRTAMPIVNLNSMLLYLLSATLLIRSAGSFSFFLSILSCFCLPSIFRQFGERELTVIFHFTKETKSKTLQILTVRSQNFINHIGHCFFFSLKFFGSYLTLLSDKI